MFEKKKNDEERLVLSPGQIAWNNFKANKLAMFGVLLFCLILILVYIVPFFTPSDINDIDITKLNQAPTRENILGTDQLGRDFFNRLIHGGKVSLKVGFLATLVSTTIGVVIGSVSGYYGGRVDNLLMRFAEIVRSFPFLPFAITLSAAIGSRVSEDMKITVIMLILGLLGWTGLARLVRGQILSLREQEFMIAAKALGVRDHNQIIRHIIPNVVSIIIVSATISMAAYILSESGLSFLGFGVVEPNASWGSLIQSAQKSVVLRERWWLWMPPGILILLTVLSINLIGDGLRDAIDPKSNRR
jgi:peptide/nickel transport system permease protein